MNKRGKTNPNNKSRIIGIYDYNDTLRIVIFDSTDRTLKVQIRNKDNYYEI